MKGDVAFLELGGIGFLGTLSVPKTVITENDVIKTIKTTEEMQKVINLMKIVFPDYWQQQSKVNFKNIYPTEQKSIIGYFLPNNELIGSVHLIKNSIYNLVSISALQVTKKFRRQGIATSLFSTIKNITRRMNTNHLYLQVNQNNRTALKTYQNWGFKQLPMMNEIKYIKETNQIPENRISLRKVTISDYDIIVKPFMKKNFTAYQTVFQLHERLKSMIEENLVYCLSLTKKHQIIVTESYDKNKLDIYMSQDTTKKGPLLSMLKIQENLDLSSYKRLLLMCNLDKSDKKSLMNYGITLKSANIKNAMYCNL